MIIKCLCGKSFEVNANLFTLPNHKDKSNKLCPGSFIVGGRSTDDISIIKKEMEPKSN